MRDEVILKEKYLCAAGGGVRACCRRRSQHLWKW